MTDQKRLIAMANPDWLTVTTTTMTDANRLAKYGLELASNDADEGQLKKWYGMGYRGWQSRTIKTGLRGENEAILMLAGKSSWAYSDTLPLGNFRVTRFDIQVTISIDPPDADIARVKHRAMKTANLHRGRPRFLKFIESPTGTTLYVGKRTSAVVLRLYDKTEHFKPGSLGKYWRYEVEFKKAAAQPAYDKWCDAPAKFTWIVNQVTAEFAKRGCEPGFSTGTKVDAIEAKATASNEEGQLAWLRKCVSPVVAQLCFKGYTEEVVQVLKLNNITNLKELL